MRDNRARLLFHVPARGLLGFGPEVATLTHGSAIVNHLFLEMRPYAGELGDDLAKGKLVAMESGKTAAYGFELASTAARRAFCHWYRRY